jgi:DNA repair protein RecO (recombination protein O)
MLTKNIYCLLLTEQMLLKTRGIVLKTLKYSETSLICDIWTEEKGLQAYIFSGVRSAKSSSSSAKAGILQLMTLLDMVTYHKETTSLHRVKEVKPSFVYRNIPFDMTRRSIGLFCTELAHKILREPEPHHELFEFLYNFYTFLDTTELPVANLHLYFMIQLATFLGFAPQGEPTDTEKYFDMQEGYFTQTPVSQDLSMDTETSRWLYLLYNASLLESAALPIKNNQRQLLLSKLIAYFNIHIENLPEIHSHRILRELF